MLFAKSLLSCVVDDLLHVFRVQGIDDVHQIRSIRRFIFEIFVGHICACNLVMSNHLDDILDRDLFVDWYIDELDSAHLEHILFLHE